MTTAQQHIHDQAGRATGISGKYLSLTTYRRDDTPVSTPVLFVEEPTGTITSTG